MPSSKPQKGINDLETVFPEIAKEAEVVLTAQGKRSGLVSMI